jgi:glycosyltransferase involved in cell wall biosynthesis
VAKKSSFNSHIFYGPELWSLQNQGGISRYYSELIKRISHVNKNTKAFIPKNRNFYVSNIPDNSKIFCDKTRTSSLIKLAQNNISNKPEDLIYHTTYYGNTKFKLWNDAGFKNVVTVFDLISEKFSKKKSRLNLKSDLKKKAILSADHIICISNTTKLDLMDIYNISEEKISVTYLGCELGNVEREKVEVGEKSSFLLYVGKRPGYKNFNNLLFAFAESKKLKDNFQIVAFGGGSFTKIENELITSLGLNETVIQVSGSDENLAQAYKKAAALIYPSFYEGFGLPPIEAMNYGCPVIASDKGSIPEICKDAAIYFDPNNIEQISITIENTLNNGALLQEKISKGVITSKQYNWQNTTSETLQVYQNMISKA